MSAALRLVNNAGRVYPHAEPSPEARRWVTVQFAEGKTRRTVLERRQTLVRLERDIGGPAIAATADQVAAWVGRDPGERSAFTVGSDLSKLRAFYGWCVRAGLRPDDPTVHIRLPRRPRTVPRPITNDQFWCLDAQAAGNRSLRAMVRLAGLAGLRVHEVGRFQGADLDWQAKTITVTGKGGHRSVIPAHPAILEVARTMPRLGYWFPSQRSSHIGGRTVSQRLRLHMIRCRVPGTPHCLRHYFGTELVTRGADIRVVQELMRHAQLNTTAIYVAVADTRKRDAIDMLGPGGKQ
ncbi:tyrosine-type recombinase/integrase [Mycobacterium riyadhense]|uniref:tyrosine-type recombinase/integrase n=1 Tax=Mycobacterium riyadhense TaxID=486698 RepID=UPI00195DE637|nr:tyrosine-type recombinase/integrase [Mycobacterium riyadhense]